MTVAATRMQAGRRWRCGRRRLGRLAADVSDAKARGRNTEPWGRTLRFYRGNRHEKGNRPPRSLGLPHAPPRHIVGHAPTVPILSHRKSRWTVRLPQANLDSLPTWETQATKAFSFLFGPLGPRSSAADPTKEGSMNDLKSRAEAPVWSALNQFPANGMPRPTRKNIQLIKN